MDARQTHGDGRKARPAAWAALAAAMLSLSALSDAAGAAQRVALVIGNDMYKHVSVLVSSKKDAADVGAALARLGFAVTPLNDATYEDLRRGLLEFMEAAVRSEIAVVFYAGHGIEVDKRNYLVPVDARLETARAVDYEAVPLELVMSSVEGASTLGLVILDAARNNPLPATMERTDPTHSTGRGLTRVEPAGKNLLVAYSVREGMVPMDGEPGGNSPYTEALLQYLEEPGLEVGMMFRRVRDAVRGSPRAPDQVPHTSGSLSGKAVYLAGEPPQPPKGTATSSAGGIAVPLPPSGDAARLGLDSGER